MEKAALLNFRRRVASYEHVELFEWEKKRTLTLPTESMQSSSDELPVGTASPLGR